MLLHDRMMRLRASEVSIDGVSVEGILRDLSLRIAAGEAVALIGRSGAGKTTVLRLLNGLTRSTAGTVTIDGQPLDGNRALPGTMRAGASFRGTPWTS